MSIKAKIIMSKTSEKGRIIFLLEQVLANSAYEGEEVDITAGKIYKEFIEPLILMIENEKGKS